MLTRGSARPGGGELCCPVLWTKLPSQATCWLSLSPVTPLPCGDPAVQLALREGGLATQAAFRTAQLASAVEALLHHHDWQYFSDTLPRCVLWQDSMGAGQHCWSQVPCTTPCLPCGVLMAWREESVIAAA